MSDRTSEEKKNLDNLSDLKAEKREAKAEAGYGLDTDTEMPELPTSAH
jgi:hypothetical protein